MDMARHLRRWLNETSLRELGGVYEGRIADVTEEKLRNRYTAQHQLQPVITFDDGCETDLITAAPILKQHCFGATFFVVSGFIGKRGFLSQPQLRELADLGFEIGCHSMTHPYLSDLDEAGLQREIADAKIALEQMIGKPVQHFSCPGGRYDSRAMRAAKDAGFSTVSTSVPRANTIATDRLSLGRVAITRGMRGEEFIQACRAQSLWKLHARSELRNRVKRVLGNSLYDRLRASLLKN